MGRSSVDWRQHSLAFESAEVWGNLAFWSIKHFGALSCMPLNGMSCHGFLLDYILNSNIFMLEDEVSLLIVENGLDDVPLLSSAICVVLNNEKKCGFHGL